MDYIEKACPTLFTFEYEWLVELCREKKKGNLPYGGGVLDQPALLMEAIRLMERSFA